jgi:hypothetical protein
MLVVVCDPAIPDEQVGARLRGGIGMERLRAAREATVRRLPRDHGHLELLKGSYSHLREFTPEVPQAIRFDGHAHARPLLEAIEILRELNATGGRKVSKGAPTAFTGPGPRRAPQLRTAAQPKILQDTDGAARRGSGASTSGSDRPKVTGAYWPALDLPGVHRHR